MQTTTHDLWTDGRSMQLTASSLSTGLPATSSSGSLVLTWTLPNNPIAYDGVVVLVSETPFTADNFPIDGTRYAASTNWQAPADSIGGALVAAAIYGFFGDNTQQTTVTVTGMDPTKVYYASAHACSNVLQYFTQGVQSYPLEANDPVKKSSPFAASIPSTATPPTNPTNGQVYYDPSSNMVLMWDDQQQAWISANQDTVKIGDSPWIDVALLYFNNGVNSLKFFDGTNWIIADPTNLRIKMGGAWAPFTSVSSVGSYPTSPSTGDFIFVTYQAALSAPPTYYVKFFSLGQWFNPVPDMVQVLINGVWTPIAISTYWNSFNSIDPYTPAVGDFFYNTAKKDLLVWTGPTGWIKADTAQDGVPLQDKVGGGTDGTFAARQQLINEVKVRMGYPQVCVELSEDSFMLAANNALTTLRQLSDSAYKLAYVSYTLLGGATGGQNVYYLNDPRDKTDTIVNVLKIHRINQLGISSLSAETGLYAQAFFNQLYQGSNVDVLSIHLMNQLSKTYEKVFAGQIMFMWDEASRQLTLLRRLLQPRERVILEVVMEKEEQELINSRWTKMWLQDWTYADALEQLGLIRSKYSSGLPGANGGLALNGDTLLNMADAKKTALRQQILDFELNNAVEMGNPAFFIG